MVIFYNISRMITMYKTRNETDTGICFLFVQKIEGRYLGFNITIRRIRDLYVICFFHC